jgi:hypothetical protein
VVKPKSKSKPRSRGGVLKEEELTQEVGNVKIGGPKLEIQFEDVPNMVLKEELEDGGI